MKVRTDFVTNSSSSSFIFGLPGENTVTIDSVNTMIKDLMSRILEFADRFFVEIRKNPKIGDKDFESVEWYNDDLRDDILEICKKMYKGSVFEEYKCDVEDLSCFITDYYPGSWQYDKAEKVKESGLNLVDFRIVDTENDSHESDEDGQYDYWNEKDSIVGCMEWYADASNNGKAVSEEKLKEYTSKLDEIDWYDFDMDSLSLKDVYDMAYKNLGEVAAVDYWCGDIPYLLVECLYSKATFACDHMG